MADLEQKLKTYYENNAEYAQSDEFLKKLKALEALQKPAPRRRYYLLPAAALLAAAVTLGAGWRYLRPNLPSNAPIPQSVTSHEAPAPVSPAPSPDEQEEPTITPKAAPRTESDIMQPQNTEGSRRRPSRRTTKPEHSTPAMLPDDPIPDDPIPVDPVPDDPTPVDPPIDNPPSDDPPSDDPPPVDPPSDDPLPDDPPDVDPEEIPDPQISASYQKEGDVELVILSNQSTGESITIDVTGCVGSPAVISQGGLAPDEIILTSVYVDSLNAFGLDISYTLYRFNDGSARAEAQIINN